MTDTEPTELPHIDGRAARAQRTREAIVDACMTLMQEGDPRPSGPRIAALSGVSVRSVFQHFDELDHLYTATAAVALDRFSRLILPIEPEAPLDQRILVLVDQRTAVLEAIMPLRQASEVHAIASTPIRALVRDAFDLLHQQTADTFATELAGVAADDRSDLLDALDIVLGWAGWETMRNILRRSPEHGRAVLARSVKDLLAGSGITG